MHIPNSERLYSQISWPRMVPGVPKCQPGNFYLFTNYIISKQNKTRDLQPRCLSSDNGSGIISSLPELKWPPFLIDDIGLGKQWDENLKHC